MASSDEDNVKTSTPRIIVFTCTGCHRIVSDSLAWTDDDKELKVIALKGVHPTNIKTDESSQSFESGSVGGCTFKSLTCVGCEEELGFYICSTTIGYRHLLGLYCIFYKNLDIYQTGLGLNLDEDEQIHSVDGKGGMKNVNILDLDDRLKKVETLTRTPDQQAKKAYEKLEADVKALAERVTNLEKEAEKNQLQMVKVTEQNRIMWNELNDGAGTKRSKEISADPGYVQRQGSQSSVHDSISILDESESDGQQEVEDSSDNNIQYDEAVLKKRKRENSSHSFDGRKGSFREYHGSVNSKKSTPSKKCRSANTSSTERKQKVVHRSPRIKLQELALNSGRSTVFQEENNNNALSAPQVIISLQQPAVKASLRRNNPSEAFNQIRQRRK